MDTALPPCDLLGDNVHHWKPSAETMLSTGTKPNDAKTASRVYTGQSLGPRVNMLPRGRTHTCVFRTARTGHARRSYSHARVVTPQTARFRTEVVLTTHGCPTFAHVFERRQHAEARTAGCDRRLSQVVRPRCAQEDGESQCMEHRERALRLDIVGLVSYPVFLSIFLEDLPVFLIFQEGPSAILYTCPYSRSEGLSVFLRDLSPATRQENIGLDYP
ncbi:hypothetical protein Bbelb_069930 [Branchiostoma belcheri]|nr:hypothetical protein Bbelb_069930 [Branchiostoma belcheri]